MTVQTGIVDIRGKQYQTVALRVQLFREANPDLTLATEVVFRDEECVVMKAYVADTSGRLLATGHAEENRKSSQINRTSALENAETSAIGRALAAYGYGGTEFATANEVQNAIHQQGAGEGQRHSRNDGEVSSAPSDKLTDAVSQPHKTQLKGPYKTKTALWKAVREFDRELRGCGDADELDAFVNMKESQELLKQCDEEVPALSITGEGMPDEYVPLRTQIARMKSEFDAVASGLVAPNGQTIINA